MAAVIPQKPQKPQAAFIVKPVVPQKPRQPHPVVPQKPRQEPHPAPRVKGDLAAAARARNESLTDFQSVMTYNSHFRPHITRDLYTPGYTRENRVGRI